MGSFALSFNLIPSYDFGSVFLLRRYCHKNIVASYAHTHATQGTVLYRTETLRYVCYILRSWFRVSFYINTQHFQRDATLVS
jgi:hypothetical protein